MVRPHPLQLKRVLDVKRVNRLISFREKGKADNRPAKNVESNGIKNITNKTRVGIRIGMTKERQGLERSQP